MEKKSFQFLRETTVETEASTYRDRARDDEKKKKRKYAFGRKQDNIRSGGSGYGKHGEETEVDEAKEFWAVIDKAKGGEVMAISSDEKGAKSSVKMSNFSKHDYHFGKDPRTLKIVKVAGSYKQGEKMIGTKLSFKEEVEITEAVHDKKSTFTMAPFEDLRSVADAALKIMTRQPQEVKEEEKEEVTKEDQPQSLTE